MSVLKRIGKILTFQEPPEPPFVLFNKKEQDNNGEGQDDSGQPREADKQKKPDKKARLPARIKKTRRVPPVKTGSDDLLSPESYINEDIPLHANLDQAKTVLEIVFRKSRNMDIVFREFSVNTVPKVKALMVYYDGLADRDVQNLAILQPLMLLSGLRPGQAGGPVEMLAEHILPGSQLAYSGTYKEIAEGVMSGSTALLFDHSPMAVLVETKGWEHRGVQRPENEAVIRGAQESFTESFRTNTALIRKALHAPDLVTEVIRVGTVSRTIVGVMYLESIANPGLVNEVIRRLKSIDTDFVTDSGMVEQMIEDHPYAMTPQLLATERPDRVVSGLVSGSVAIVVDNSPYTLVAPATFFSLFQTGEDSYFRWPAGAAIRTIRLLGLVIATLLPGVFVAVSGYHHEMIPTDLLMSIAGNRENVPFPSIVELLLMETAFELIREAGIRIPGVVGTTLGIVGALILGQAAVAANIVSPVTIIVVAVTAIGSFAVPNFSLSLSLRIVRFFYIFLGGFLGMFGIILGLFVHLGMLSSVKSFGVPYFAPVAPTTASSPDLFIRGQIWSMETRPDYLNTRKKQRQPEVSRGWVANRRKRDTGADNGKD